MILEVGAGGCVMVTPPAKGSLLEKEMFIDGGAAGVEYIPREEPAMVKVIDGGPEGTIYEGDAKCNPNVEYERYSTHVYDRDEDGVVKVRPNPENPATLALVVLHKTGDLVLDVDGNPIIKGSPEYKRYEKPYFDEDFGDTKAVGELVLTREGKPIKHFNWRNTIPRVTFNGIRDGETRFRCSSPHLSELKYLTDLELAEFAESVMKEAVERVGGKSYYCWRCESRTVYHNGNLECACASQETKGE